MSVLQSIILGLIQGLTEFLPISSSGHLILLPKIFGWEDQGIFFDVVLHLGTLLAVLLYFRKTWLEMIFAWIAPSAKTGFEKSQVIFLRNLSLFLIIGTIPAGLAGYFFSTVIEEKLRSAEIVSLMLISVGILMFLAEKISSKKTSFESIGIFETLVLGVAQTLALIPGTSRSGITITAGLFTGLKRGAAAKFSFLLSLPIILGAGIFELKDIFSGSLEKIDYFPLFIGFLTSALAGFLAIKFLLSFLQKNSLLVFIIYRILLGTIILLAL